MTLAEQLNNHLDHLRASIPEIRGALIASTDGMVIAARVGVGDPNRMAAMVATALGLGKRICETFGGGSLNETSVSGTEGQVHIFSTGPKGVLAIVVGSGANVGLINLECRETAKSIAQLLN